MLLRDGKKLCYHIFSYFMKNKEALMDLCSFMDLEKGDVCRLAVLLAMSRTEEEERAFIRAYEARRLKAAATTVFGYSISFEETVIRNVVNLCLNKGIIDRKRAHVHPVAHCVLEAAQSTRASDAIGQNFKFKAAAVRRGNEFALCFYGDLGLHALSSHKTVGVGYQILGK